MAPSAVTVKAPHPREKENEKELLIEKVGRALARGPCRGAAHPVDHHDSMRDSDTGISGNEYVPRQQEPPPLRDSR